MRLLWAEPGCLLLVADAPSTSAEGGDVCSVRAWLCARVFVKCYFVPHLGVQNIPPGQQADPPQRLSPRGARQDL